MWQIGAFIAAAEESVARHARGPRRNTEDTVRVMFIDEIAACGMTCGGGRAKCGAPHDARGDRKGDIAGV